MARNIMKNIDSINDSAPISELETKAHVIENRLAEALKDCPIRIGSKRRLEVDR